MLKVNRKSRNLLEMELHNLNHNLIVLSQLCEIKLKLNLRLQIVITTIINIGCLLVLPNTIQSNKIKSLNTTNHHHYCNWENPHKTWLECQKNSKGSSWLVKVDKSQRVPDLCSTIKIINRFRILFWRQERLNSFPIS